MKIEIKVPSFFELLIVKIFGKKFQNNCMDSYVYGYRWRGKMYTTKTWIKEDYDTDT